MNNWLYTQNLAAILIIAAAIAVLLWESSFRIGCRLAKRGFQVDAQSQTIQSALLTLFGLVLGFTFSMAAARYETRRDVILHEANTIGTAILRADELPDAKRTAMRDALRKYLDARVEYYQAGYGSDSLTTLEATIDKYQREAWAIASVEARERQTPINASVLTSLNDMIDARGQQQVTFENVVPPSVIIFLTTLAILVVGVMGCMNGLCGTRRVVISSVYGAAVLLTLAIVIDLDRPRRGLIRMNYASLIRLQQQNE